MDLNFLKGTAIFGIIGAIVGFWGQIKAFLWRITSIIIQKVEISTEEAHGVIISYLIESHKKLTIYDKIYGAKDETYRNGKFGLVPYEKFGNNTIIFISKKKCLNLINYPFLFKSTDNSKNQQNEQRNYYDNSNQNKIYSSIIFIRGTVDVEKIFTEATKNRNNISWQIDDKEEKENRFDIFYLPDKETNNHAYYCNSKTGFTWYRQKQYKLLGVKHEELGKEKISQGNALNNLFFPKEIKELINIISLWVKSENWYKEKNIPWKRGWLLYGPPGTGKTALVRAFAEDLNMPIYVFSLSQMTNNDLISCWRNLQLNIPCIALIEDIDNIFNGRKNIYHTNNFLAKMMESNNEENQNNEEKVSFTPLTFDCLLNCLDGVDKSNGVFTIITTNDITKIDNAIGCPVENLNVGKDNFTSTRPGRIDKVIKLSHMQKENKIEMANKILGEFEDRIKEVLNYIDEGREETPAQFQEYCAQIAIQEYWKNKET